MKVALFELLSHVSFIAGLASAMAAVISDEGGLFFTARALSVCLH